MKMPYYQRPANEPKSLAERQLEPQLREMCERGLSLHKIANTLGVPADVLASALAVLGLETLKYRLQRELREQREQAAKPEESSSC